MLAIYRELKNDQTQTLELERHLASCDACKQLLAQQSLVGERLRSLPTIEPLPSAQTKLMQALAHEHLNFLQRSPSPGTSTPPPAFLAPYLQQQSQNTAHADPFIAFSTADTGPLPIIRVPRKRRPSRQMSHVAILGMAAAFLMVLLIGSLTSLLLVANRGIPGSGNSASVATFAEIAMARYTATTPFSHAVSAAATKNAIYYSAYGDGQTGWMLERLNTRTKISTPLLSASSVSPLIILGSSDEWLAWLQLDAATTIADKHVGSTTTTIAPRSWVLRVLSLSSDQATTAVPVTIAHDIFNQATVPQWVHTPIQGIRFVPDGLLVALIDGKGSAHLINYQLTPDNVEDEQQLATVNNGHIITSPASNSDSSSIYWSEEWLGDNGTLHSNIWTQQTVTMLPPIKADGFRTLSSINISSVRMGCHFIPRLLTICSSC